MKKLSQRAVKIYREKGVIPLLSSIKSFSGRKIRAMLCPSHNNNKNNIYSIHEYLDDDGEFDYEEYKDAQEYHNKRKLGFVWAKEENVEFLSNYLEENVDTINKGVCHGTRRGLEQKWFRQMLDADVFGTEISETAKEFEYTIQWDFHDIKDEWKSEFDFIYTNSFDHAYDPELAINNWMKCLKNDGVCIIEHSDSNSTGSSESDPFSYHKIIFPYLILDWSDGAFSVKEYLDAPVDAKMEKPGNESVDDEYTNYDTGFFIIEKNK